MTKHAQSRRSIVKCDCGKCQALRRFMSTIDMSVLADSASVLQGYRERMWPESVTEARADMRKA